MRPHTTWYSTLLVTCITTQLACQGDLLSPLGPSEASRDAAEGSATSGEPSGSGDFAKGNFDPSMCEGRDVHPGPMPGLVRLTHAQYDYAVLDFLGLDARARAEFVEDQEFFGFSNNADKLAAPENQVLRYRAQAERLAAEAAGNPARLQTFVPCVGAARDASCRDTFIRDGLKYLFRRPLNDAEQARYRALFDAGKDLYEEGDAFARGLRIVLEAALQSPNFIYRQELSDTLDGRVVALGNHELAARLALTLWASLPDAALMAKADAGTLSDEAVLESEARRMLKDPKAARVLDDFNAQWLELEKLRFDKDPVTFPSFNRAAVEASAEKESLAFTRYIAQRDGGTISDLFTSTTTFVDATLAALYGLSGNFTNELTQVELDPAQRAGLLTQTSFLVGHADALDPSPIHRGAYVQKRLLCTTFGPLPSNVGNLPERSGDIVTTRDRVEAKTAAPACQTCHASINPTGFAFEHFDTLGQYRDQDHGEPVNASASLSLDDQNVTFNGAVEFAQKIAASDTAKRCYETQWFRYALGRGETEEDLCLLYAIDQRVKEKSYDIRELLVELTLSRAFRFRAQEDL